MKNDDCLNIVVRPATGGFAVELRGPDAACETFVSHRDLDKLYEVDFLVTQEGWLIRFCGPDVVFRRNSSCAYTGSQDWWQMLVSAESAR